ncbi:hypothetical protein HaLaN_20172 [Haematococcus lacustris]|uniref:Uncharacterized protein n=1 Tax=Haematococcus lacustris TaxID=44745 RepID=A0A6A0A186_HAELA|nr:hypothetical protein HaLaN_20172 [Haematococcus lacustris]
MDVPVSAIGHCTTCCLVLPGVWGQKLHRTAHCELKTWTKQLVRSRGRKALSTAGPQTQGDIEPLYRIWPSIAKLNGNNCSGTANRVALPGPMSM